MRLKSILKYSIVVFLVAGMAFAVYGWLDTAVSLDHARQQQKREVSTGTYGISYDNMDRLTQTSTAYAFIAGKTFTVGYGYDAGSNRTSMTDPAGGRPWLVSRVYTWGAPFFASFAKGGRP